jgi:hypothetical protein
MKLLLCLECDDVFNLDYEEKNCKCGKTRGKYVDQINAVYSGHAVPLGFNNISLAAAVRNQPEQGEGEEFTAFIIPKVCPTFKKKE